MRRSFLAIAILCGLVPFASVRAADEQVDLLPHGDFSKHWETTGNWKSNEKEGTVTLTPRPGESGWTRYDAYLTSKKEYKDFEIEFEYKVEKGGNSGFYFHVGNVKEPVSTGIEVQIYDSGSKKEGDKLTDHDSGGVIPGIPPSKNTAKPAGEWNKFHITCKGDNLVIKLNGETVNEVDLQNEKLKSRPKSGFISFQDHGLPLSLRNIKIKAL